MNLPSAVFVLRWMVRDTFRQSLGSRAFWLVLGLSGLAILLCLSVRVEGYTAIKPEGEIELYGRDKKEFTGLNPGRGYVSLAFGLVRWEQGRDGAAEVLDMQWRLAMFGAGALGILLVLLWSSGFLPEFLQPDAASVLLAKPIPRWAVLVGKYLGVVAFMALQTTVFVGGTWLALGWKTGYWFPGYLYTIPISVLCFAFLFSFMTLLAVWTRSTVLCLVGTLVFWTACAAVTYTRHEMVVRQAPPSPGRSAAEAGYWVLPKPADLVFLLHTLLPPQGKHLPPIHVLTELEKHDEFHPGLSAACSLLFSVAVLGLAAFRFSATEY